MKIEYISEYTKHGCNFQGNLGIVNYWDEAKHGFNAAYKSGGLYDKMAEAGTLVARKHKNITVLISVPDFVFRINTED